MQGIFKFAMAAMALTALLWLTGCGTPTTMVSVSGEDNLAINGYDPVAYHAENAAVEGSPEHTATWRGATWRFATEAHKTLFEKNPKEYAPAYGGYCAWAIAHGKVVTADPELWSIRGDQLYLNLNSEVQTKWLDRYDDVQPQAEENWQKLQQTLTIPGEED